MTIAAGLIAFGPSRVVPAARQQVEQQATEKVEDTAQPMVDNLTDTVRTFPSTDADADAATVTVTVTVKDEATSAADDVKTQAQDSKDTVQHAAQ